VVDPVTRVHARSSCCRAHGCVKKRFNLPGTTLSGFAHCLCSGSNQPHKASGGTIT
jgi:hypothetical protein